MAHGHEGEPGADGAAINEKVGPAGVTIDSVDADTDHSQLVAALEAIRDYEPDEVVKDEFAYDRMVESYRDAARNGLAADGTARLQHDVVTLPPDQQALGLVEAILEQTHVPPPEPPSRTGFMTRLAIIQGDAERLKVLLEKQS